METVGTTVGGATAGVGVEGTGGIEGVAGTGAGSIAGAGVGTSAGAGDGNGTSTGTKPGTSTTPGTKTGTTTTGGVVPPSSYQQAIAPFAQQPAAYQPTPLSPFKAITAAMVPATFESALANYLKMVDIPTQTGTQTEKQITPQQAMQNYFSYGQIEDINKLLGLPEGMFRNEEIQAAVGGHIMATPLMATGGGTRYGQYAGGGLNALSHSGKMRVDFRKGDAVTGPGDGQSDDIPAMLADGEFVFPADVVSALGNGSTKAGSDKLYEMMHSIRAYHRSAKPKDLPPPAKKSPLDYLKKGRS